MSTCLTCASWKLKGAWLQRHGMGSCAHDSRYSFYGPSRTCEKHSPTTASVIEVRKRYLAQIGQ